MHDTLVYLLFVKTKEKAEVVKLVDTQASGACRGNSVEVQILFSAYKYNNNLTLTLSPRIFICFPTTPKATA